MNPLFNKLGGAVHKPAMTAAGSRMQQLAGVVQYVRGLAGMFGGGGNAETIVRGLAAVNPQFRKFCNDIQGKSMEQVAREYGINADDINAVAGMLKK